MLLRSCIVMIFCAISFFGCKKLEDSRKEQCFIPYVDFVAYNVNPNTLEVTFSGVTSYNGVIKTHLWDFGDGTTYSGDSVAVHRYPSLSSSDTAKTYRIRYTVSNDCGEAYWTKEITIRPCLPDVKFTYTFLNDSTVTFTNQTTSAGTTNYTWNFGDGTSSADNSSSVTKKFASEGNYSVSLKATNSCGDNFYSATVSICKKPVASQVLTRSGCSTISLNASASKGGVKYQWNFGNGVTLPTTPSSSPTITYNYPAAGNYTVTLYVSNENNCGTATDTESVSISSLDLQPNSNWTYSSDDLDFNFSRANVTNANSYSWDFGDGTTSGLQNPANKSYQNPGTYFVTLQASNSCSNYSFSASIHVPFYKFIPNAPNAGFQDVIAISPSQIYYLSTNGKLYITDTAGHWSSALNLPGSLNFNAGTRLAKDPNNQVWIYGSNEVARLNALTLLWTSFYSSTGFPSSTTINSMAVDKAGNLWTIGNNQVRRNNRVIGNNIQFSSIAYSAAKGMVWMTSLAGNDLFFVNDNSNQLFAITVPGISNGSNAMKIDTNGDLYFTTGTGIMRCNSSGSTLNNYTSSNTANLLKGRPKVIDIDNKGNIWALYNDNLLKIPVSLSTSSKNYSINSDFTSISSFDILNVTNTDNDIIIAKTTANGAMQVK